PSAAHVTQVRASPTRTTGGAATENRTADVLQGGRCRRVHRKPNLVATLTKTALNSAVYHTPAVIDALYWNSKDQCAVQKAENLARVYSASTQERDALGFVGRLLVQATFPHSAPKSNEWTRTNGDLKLHMLAPSEI